MGTSYYAVTKCHCCDNEVREHIGKSSAGWAFALNTSKYKDISDWINHLASDRVYITADDTFEPVSLGTLVSVMTNRGASFHHGPDRVGGTSCIDYFDYDFS